MNLSPEINALLDLAIKGVIYILTIFSAFKAAAGYFIEKDKEVTIVFVILTAFCLAAAIYITILLG